MDLYDFNRLNSEQRASVVWATGNFLAVRLDGECSVCLYHVDKFFAEVWYRAADNQIQTVRGFKSNACLEPYLNMVDLTELTF